MLKVAVCDDEKAVLSEVRLWLNEYEKINGNKIKVDIFEKGEDLISNIESNINYDLIFLDIELITMTGIDVGKIIRNDFNDYVSKIAFITSKDGYELELFKIQPLEFIKKPLSLEKIFYIVNLTKKIIKIDNTIYTYKKDGEYISVYTKDILYFEKIDREVKIVTIDKEDSFYGNLKPIIEQLPKSFITPHNSFIINYTKIKKLRSSEIIISNGAKIPVSKRNIKNIREFLKKYKGDLINDKS